MSETLSDEKKLEQLKEEELKKAASEFEYYSHYGSELNLSVVPERVFTAETDDEPFSRNFKICYPLKRKQSVFHVDGEMALYVNDHDRIMKK